MAHDPEETVKCGDTIVIKKMEKPLNKNVLFQVRFFLSLSSQTVLKEI